MGPVSVIPSLDMDGAVPSDTHLNSGGLQRDSSPAQGKKNVSESKCPDRRSPPPKPRQGRAPPQERRSAGEAKSSPLSPAEACADSAGGHPPQPRRPLRAQGKKNASESDSAPEVSRLRCAPTVTHLGQQ